MATVYLAEDLEYKRKVAVKVVDLNWRRCSGPNASCRRSRPPPISHTRIFCPCSIGAKPTLSVITPCRTLNASRHGHRWVSARSRILRTSFANPRIQPLQVAARGRGGVGGRLVPGWLRRIARRAGRDGGSSPRPRLSTPDAAPGYVYYSPLLSSTTYLIETGGGQVPRTAGVITRSVSLAPAPASTATALHRSACCLARARVAQAED